MAWQSDNDFLNDLKNMDDFGFEYKSFSDHYYNPSSVPKPKVTKPKRGLFVELENEEKELNATLNDTGLENNKCLSSKSVEKQIEFATGKIYNNEYLMTQWNPQHKANKYKRNDEFNKGFIFKPKVEVKPLDPASDVKYTNNFPEFPENVNTHTAKLKKPSVASVIEQSVLSNKVNDGKRKEVPIKMEDKPISNTSPAKFRFALPISRGQISYDETEEDYRSDNKWSTCSNFSFDSSSDFTESSRSGNKDSSSNFGDVEYDDSSYLNNRQKHYKKKTNTALNISSKIDFPPLG